MKIFVKPVRKAPATSLAKLGIAGNPQEALFAVERMLEKNIDDLETAVYRK